MKNFVKNFLDYFFIPMGVTIGYLLGTYFFESVWMQAVITFILGWISFILMKQIFFYNSDGIPSRIKFGLGLISIQIIFVMIYLDNLLPELDMKAVIIIALYFIGQLIYINSQKHKMKETEDIINLSVLVILLVGINFSIYLFYKSDKDLESLLLVVVSFFTLSHLKFMLRSIMPRNNAEEFSKRVNYITGIYFLVLYAVGYYQFKIFGFQVWKLSLLLIAAIGMIFVILSLLSRIREKKERMIREVKMKEEIAKSKKAQDDEANKREQYKNRMFDMIKELKNREKNNSLLSVNDIDLSVLFGNFSHEFIVDFFVTNGMRGFLTVSHAKKQIYWKSLVVSNLSRGLLELLEKTTDDAIIFSLSEVICDCKSYIQGLAGYKGSQTLLGDFNDLFMIAMVYNKKK